MRLILLLLVCATLQAATLRYWIEPCSNASTGCKKDDPELAQWAMDAWQKASGGKLELVKTDDRRKAHILVHWVSGDGGLYGETRPIMINGVRGADVYVLPTIVPPDVKDELLRDAIVYLTCLHETGHALGLAHTAEFADIMYSFQYGGDIAAYFGRYRKLLANRADIQKYSGMSAADAVRVR